MRNLGISPDMWQVAILDTKIKKLQGSEMISFPATFVAGNDIIIMGNIKVLK